MGDGFTGFPPEATRFFRDLARNNNRDWFQAHKDIYERSCREPMKALVAEFEPFGGASSISRINRDMRFSRDGAPYKTHIAAGVAGNYINLSAEGVYVGTGVYRPEPAALRQLRTAIADDTSGRELARIVNALRRKGYTVDTHESLSSAPKGFAADHPRIDLLRMKDIFAGTMFPPGPGLESRKLLTAITRVMDDIRPLGAWLSTHVGGRSKK